MYFKIKKKLRRILSKYFGLKRGHHLVLGKALAQVLGSFDKPLLLETGCIRNVNEGTDSTLIIASTVRDRGTFYSFELRPEHIEQCRQACAGYNQYINYVEGDSIAKLEQYVAEGKLPEVHFAFLDSRNDSEHIWREFRAIESRFVPGSVLVVDDVLWADKGRRLRPYLEASPQWTTRIFNVENGILTATRRQPSRPPSS